MQQGGVSVVNRTRGTLPPIPFAPLAHKVLGKKYELSVVFVTPKESTRLSKSLRHGASNVLSFPLSPHSGEIVLCPSVARSQARSYGMHRQEFLAYLFIHGLLHLKGMKHGATMESSERSLLRSLHI